MISLANALANIVNIDSGVDAAYKHYAKIAAPLDPLVMPQAVLKWYELNTADLPISAATTQLARSFLSKAGLEASGLGFVILHRCGNDFYFLIVCTWRNSNEIWETVFYKGGDAMQDFAPFPRERSHKPTFCVWELVPTLHEQQAWVRFLNSSRDEAAADAWLHDCFSGVV